tara:strand:+ start:1112 stop:1522 length:411 start_codon:yes stop_codon:yes gene_type:complete
MRAKLRKLVKIVAEKANDTLNNENISWYLEQLAKNGFDVERYPGSVSIKEPVPDIIKEKPPVVIVVEEKPKKPKKEKKLEKKKAAVIDYSKPKWISLKGLSYKELRAMGKKEKIKNSYRMKKEVLRKLLEEKINDV